MALKSIGRLIRRIIPRPIRRLASIASFAAAIVTGQWWLAAGIAAITFAKKPSMPTDNVLDRLNISINPQALGKWVFGETALATDVLYSEKIGDDKLVYLIAGAAHEIESFGDLYMNDELITLSGANATGDWLNALSVYRNLGTDTQTALAIPSSLLPSTAKGEGVAHYALVFTFRNQPKLADGIPARITQVAKGAKVYDPRLDSTRGGTGSHRADDQSTWQYTNSGDDIGANWALIVAHYLLGYRSGGKLIYGVGVDPNDVDWDQVAAMADVCDMIVDAKPRYRIGGIMPATQDHGDILRQLESAVGGKVSKVAGKYYIWCPHDDLSPLDTITDEDIIREVGVNFSPSAPIQEIYNAIRGRYVEPDTLYQPIPYPEIEEAAAIAEDGRVRIKEHDFSVIQDVEIAQRVAREIIRRTRFSATWQFALGPVGMLYQPFDVLTLNIQETNNQPQLVRIVNMQFSVGGAVMVECIEEDASIYDTSLPLGTPVTRLDVGTYDPSAPIPVTGLAATDITITGAAGSVSDALRVTWDDPGGFVRETQVRFRITGTTDYQGVPPSSIDQTSAIIVPVEPLTEYQIEVRHVNLSGTQSAFVQVVETTGGGVFPPTGLQNRLVVLLDLENSEHINGAFLEDGPNDGNYISSVIGPFVVSTHEHFLTLSFEARSTGAGDQNLQIYFQRRVDGGSWAAVDDLTLPAGTFVFTRNNTQPPNGDGSPPTFTTYTRRINEFIPVLPASGSVEYRVVAENTDAIVFNSGWIIRRINARVRQLYVGD